MPKTSSVNGYHRCWLQCSLPSPLLASVLFTFERIEDKLPDYTGLSYDLFRNVWRINTSYHQWGYEEQQHSEGAEHDAPASHAAMHPSMVTRSQLRKLQQLFDAHKGMSFCTASSVSASAAGLSQRMR